MEDRYTRNKYFDSNKYKSSGQKKILISSVASLCELNISTYLHITFI